MGDAAGFPWSGSDPEENTSPRSALPTMVKGPASPEPTTHRADDDVIAVPSALQEMGMAPATASRLKERCRRRRQAS